MENLRIRLRGISPILLHSAKLSNPLDPASKAHKTLTAKKQKTDEDHELIAHSEWKNSFYWRDDLGPCVPTANVRSSIVEGAKLSKLGKALERGTFCLEQYARLDYTGPRDLDAMWKSGNFCDCRGVVVSGKRIMRYRPMFTDWSVEVDVTYNPGVVEAEQILRSAETAGMLIGLGDFRPNTKGGPFGRYNVERVN